MQAFDREPMATEHRSDLDDQIHSLGVPPRETLTELDSRGCDRLDPSAVRALDRATRRFSANGRELVLRHASPALRRQLIEEGLTGVLKVSAHQR